MTALLLAEVVETGPPRRQGGKPLSPRSVESCHAILPLDDWTLGVLAHRREVQQREARTRDGRSTLGEEWELAFTTPEGEPLDPLRVTWAFRKLVASLPLPRIRLHDLRHTHATLLLGIPGTSIKVVSDRLGHASARFTLDVYAHALPVMDAAAADRFAQLLGHAD